MTNAAFLLGSFFVLDGCRPKDVWAPLNTLDVFEPYCDISKKRCEFKLYLMDCWKAVQKAQQQSWIALGPDCGCFSLEEYDHYTDPANGDLHEVVPGKLVAFRGPQGNVHETWEDKDGVRYFHPAYYVDVFREIGVSTVVRLNDKEYDSNEFVRSGIQHFDLPFADGTAPSRDIVDRFFAIVDAAPGLVAVHCQAGLGRTGSLIAAHMIKTLNFSAREAIAWTRIVRPGSVSGEQQQFLRHFEQVLHERRRPSLSSRTHSPITNANTSAHSTSRVETMKRFSRPASCPNSPLSMASGRNTSALNELPHRSEEETLQRNDAPSQQSKTHGCSLRGRNTSACNNLPHRSEEETSQKCHVPSQQSKTRGCSLPPGGDLEFLSTTCELEDDSFGSPRVRVVKISSR
eukprot:CAMPEP_0181296240 /NCGR_PEP_ID=MMETSP1101-20121128/4592_1 /TAXON_ID=46948 /ORGANISM="Rhodomonas abbreviata, Strain Caron Lab Isolate" /LENGTH=401 /DNA_ID=CAMNT_0023401079 /DNA_START=351 /DNA_END=1556 /DNA_ORIENTATION=+